MENPKGSIRMISFTLPGLLPKMSRWLICVFASFVLAESRLHRHFGELRGKARLLSDKLVPNPSSTTARLNSVENSIVQWSDAGVSNHSSNVSSSAYQTNIDGVPTGTVTDLDQALKQIENQSNAGIDSLTGTLAMSSMTVDLMRLNMTRLERRVNQDIARIDRILNELGDVSTNGVSGQLRNVQTQIDQFKTQLNSVMGEAGPNQFIGRINQLSDSVTAVSDRLSALEKKGNGPQSAESQGAANSMAASASFQFVLESWTGRIALGGAVFGIVALVLSIIALTRLPPKPAAAEEKPEEQVLMDAGEGEAQPVEGEDPNAEGYVYEEPQAEEEQQ